MATPKPHIFLLSIETEPYFDEIYAPLINTLATTGSLHRAKTPDSAQRYLVSNNPSAILVTDAYLTTPTADPALRNKVLEYIACGGTVLLMGLFASLVKPDELNAFFTEYFGLSWRKGDYHRTDVVLNNHGPARAHRKGLAEIYSLKAVFLSGVGRGDAVYLPVEDAVTQSNVFGSARVEDRTQSPVALAAVGKGLLGYVGDVNGEGGSERVVVAMCGL